MQRSALGRSSVGGYFRDRCQPASKLAHAPLRSSFKAKPKRFFCQVKSEVKAMPGPSGVSRRSEETGPVAPVVRTYDFVVLGSGIAGLTYAIKVAKYGTVAIITKAKADEGCTALAQGGISAVLDEMGDSVDLHIQDTLQAGEFLNSRRAVELVCREARKAVLELDVMGARFTKESGKFHLTREGGHSARRIVHKDDLTGKEVEQALLERAENTKGITFFPHHLAVDLVQDLVRGVPHCLGVDVLDQKSCQLMRFISPVTMLATGGAGQVYPNTTNPSVITGDGMAMAYRAGAAVSNMEFVQFHPTGFASPGSSSQMPGGRTFLISEAVRGEGGLLLNSSGKRFMLDYHKDAELAPRDVVARAIQREMQMTGADHVWLDISHKQKSEVKNHFPNIYKECKGHGIDITSEPIPVAPAQHYMCGGVQTGLHGETSLLGLFAIGEVACSGLHGANRLASNSLLEGLVFGAQAVKPSLNVQEYILQYGGQQLHHAATHACFGHTVVRPLDAACKERISAMRQKLQQIMFNDGGIERNKADLLRGSTDVFRLRQNVRTMQEELGLSVETLELRNMALVGELILLSALSRHPDKVDSLAKPTVLKADLRPPVSAGARRSTVKVAKNTSVFPDRSRYRDVAVRSSDTELS